MVGRGCLCLEGGREGGRERSEGANREREHNLNRRKEEKGKRTPKEGRGEGGEGGREKGRERRTVQQSPAWREGHCERQGRQ